jgi:hypothetical protein
MGCWVVKKKKRGWKLKESPPRAMIQSSTGLYTAGETFLNELEAITIRMNIPKLKSKSVEISSLHIRRYDP